jgi:hypothetical protein
MYKQFAFEGDVHQSLDCVPLTVRRKLDLAELKISLTGWQALPREERLALCHLPVDIDEDVAVYREVLGAFAARAGVPLSPLAGDPLGRGAWSAAGVAARVLHRLGPAGGLDETRASSLTEEERYALFKLADPKRDTAKLELAMYELGLREGAAPAAPEVLCERR